MSSQDIFGDEDSSDESEKETTPKPSKDVEMKDAAASEDKETENKPQKSAFDSDDDDDEDESGGNKAPKETPNPDDTAKKIEKDPFAEEDSDDSDAKKEDEEDRKKKEKGSDDDDEDEVGGKKTSPQKESQGKKNDDDALEDSDDDDEPEFDDTGAVTGSSHNKGFQKKVSKKSALETLREQEEAEEAEARAADDDAPAKPLPPKVDPRTMVVLEPERPSSSTSIHITKLPNLIGIQPEAFDAATYSAKAEEEEYKGFVHDMIRWRYKKDNDGNVLRDEDGNLLRESNTRLVQWEDGSYTLHVGKEALVVDNIDSSQKIGPVDVVTGRTATFAGLNGYLYLSQVANFREPKKEGEDDGEDGESGFKETGAGTVLECVGAVGSRMTARPSSLRSEAHKSLTVAVRKKTIKRAQIAEIVTQYDPEKMKEERIKQQDGMAKEKARKKNYGDSYRSRARPRLGMTRDYLEDDYDDFDSTNLRAIKKRTMNAEEDDYDDGFIDYGDDEDDDEGTFNRKPRKRTKNRLDDSDDEDEAPAAEAASGKAAEEDKNDEDDDDDDDDDDEVVTPVKSSKKRSHQAVFDDDDSD